eukprot:GHVO01053454.1.p1 GENE.GHVO01053454.1~~GHVO01053454.1.p1  ORF type:complete len:578 (+),score=110.33 GHVO01053454.1:1713-3446(+)
MSESDTSMGSPQPGEELVSYAKSLSIMVSAPTGKPPPDPDLPADFDALPTLRRTESRFPDIDDVSRDPFLRKELNVSELLKEVQVVLDLPNDPQAVTELRALSNKAASDTAWRRTASEDLILLDLIVARCGRIIVGVNGGGEDPPPDSWAEVLFYCLRLLSILCIGSHNCQQHLLSTGLIHQCLTHAEELGSADGNRHHVPRACARLLANSITGNTITRDALWKDPGDMLISVAKLAFLCETPEMIFLFIHNSIVLSGGVPSTAFEGREGRCALMILYAVALRRAQMPEITTSTIASESEGSTPSAAPAEKRALQVAPDLEWTSRGTRALWSQYRQMPKIYTEMKERCHIDYVPKMLQFLHRRACLPSLGIRLEILMKGYIGDVCPYILCILAALSEGGYCTQDAPCRMDPDMLTVICTELHGLNVVLRDMATPSKGSLRDFDVCMRSYVSCISILSGVVGGYFERDNTHTGALIDLMTTIVETLKNLSTLDPLKVECIHRINRAQLLRVLGLLLNDEDVAKHLPADGLKILLYHMHLSEEQPVMRESAIFALRVATSTCSANMDSFKSLSGKGDGV